MRTHARAHTHTLLLKLDLCPPLPNRNAETEFWVKERKSFDCFARQRRPQQANVLKTLPSIGKSIIVKRRKTAFRIRIRVEGRYAFFFWGES